MKIKHVVLFLSVIISLVTIVWNAYVETIITMLLVLAVTYVIDYKKVKIKNNIPRILVSLIILYFTIGIVTITMIITRLAKLLSTDQVFLSMVALISIMILSILIENRFDEVYNAIFGKLDPSYDERRIVYFGRYDIYLITFENDEIVVESLIKRYRKRMDLGEFELFKESEEVWKAFS